MTRQRGTAATAKHAHEEREQNENNQASSEDTPYIANSFIDAMQHAQQILALSSGREGQIYQPMQHFSNTHDSMDGNGQSLAVQSWANGKEKQVNERNVKQGKKGQGKVAKRDIHKEFEVYFGDEGQLANWQRLVRDLGLEGDFSSITKCRKAFRKVWVNIVDFMDALHARNTSKTSKYLTVSAMNTLNIGMWGGFDVNGTDSVNIDALNVIISALDINADNQLVQMDPVDVKKFSSQQSLGAYTRKTKKFYPLNKAKKEGPIRALLAHVR